MNENPTGDEPGADDDLYYLKPEDRVDLTNCDREPIHIINHVQPHGALLVLNPVDLTIVQVSENVCALFGIDAIQLQGEGIDRFFAPDHVEVLRQNVAERRLDANPLYLFSAPVAGQGQFDIVAHIYRGALIMEVEPALSAARSPDCYSLIKKTFARFKRAATLRELAQVVCEEVRQLSGFDRVMMYQFLEDDSGKVIAEDLAPAQCDLYESYLGLHYPSSDIPRQARALFVLNPVRMIPDAAYTPAPLLPATNPMTGGSCDLSYASLRGVSSMHTEYLLNMGVRASMSLAIVKDERLWGLIACHHYGPRNLAYDVRTACEFLAQVVSLQIAEKEMNEQAKYRQHMETMHHALIANMARQRTLLSVLTDDDPNIMGFVDCGGCAVLLGDVCRLFGATPDEAGVRKLAAWLKTAHDEEIFATRVLPALYNPAHAFKASACGMLALQIAHGSQYILWFRPEVAQTVTWAGIPTKALISGPNGDRLTPRKSFAAWQETVRDTSLAWKAVEIEAAQRLRVSLIEAIARLAEELTQTNHKLVRSNTELDAFAYIASHDLKEPVRNINHFASFLKEDYGDLLPDAGRKQIDIVLKMTKRLDALINSLLHYSRVGRLELNYESCDLNSLLSDVLEGLKSRIQDTGAEIRIPRRLPAIVCDQIQLAEVFHNLIFNALKYNDRAAKWVEIGYLDAANTDRYTFYIRDNGIGIEEEQHESIFRIFQRLNGQERYGGGTGVGLTIVRKILERHGGTVRVESTPGQGSTFLVTLPMGLSNE